MGEPRDEHVPVLLESLLDVVGVGPGERVLDLTVGLGGHAAALAGAAGPAGLLIGIDVDAASLEHAERRLAATKTPRVLWHGNFADFEQALALAGCTEVDVMVADLGLSSLQLSDPSRGFSFAADGPLDMRIDSGAKTTAEDLVNGLPESQLADLIYQNSQERFSRRIAKRICAARRSRRIRKTVELANIVAAAIGVDPSSRKSRIHPATRTFLALRIAVNDELSSLRRMLGKAPSFLSVGGRLAVISFHSLEDAVVKRDFRKRQKEGVYEILTKGPVTADAAERSRNPRSRSAKLRAVRRSQRRSTPDGSGAR